MDHIISPCCKAFTMNNGTIIFCTNCNEKIGEVEEDEDIVIGVSYNSTEDMISTIDTSTTSNRITKRLAKDKTCVLVDNVTCRKCGSKCRYVRNSSIQYVCSECREIQ